MNNYNLINSIIDAIKSKFKTIVTKTDSQHCINFQIPSKDEENANRIVDFIKDKVKQTTNLTYSDCADRRQGTEKYKIVTIMSNETNNNSLSVVNDLHVNGSNQEVETHSNESSDSDKKEEIVKEFNIWKYVFIVIMMFILLNYAYERYERSPLLQKNVNNVISWIPFINRALNPQNNETPQTTETPSMQKTEQNSQQTNYNKDL